MIGIFASILTIYRQERTRLKQPSNLQSWLGTEQATKSKWRKDLDIGGNKTHGIEGDTATKRGGQARGWPNQTRQSVLRTWQHHSRDGARALQIEVRFQEARPCQPILAWTAASWLRSQVRERYVSRPDVSVAS